MIYLILIICICIISVIVCSMLMLSARRDVIEMRKLYNCMVAISKKDIEVDGELAYLQSLYGVDDYMRERKRKYENNKN